MCDWKEYEELKKELKSKNLPEEEYEMRIRQILDLLEQYNGGEIQ